MNTNTIVMYCKDSCPFCIQAEKLLKKYNVQIQKIKIDQFPEERNVMVSRTGLKTVPQIFFGNKHIGGFDNLKALDENGQLILLFKTE